MHYFKQIVMVDAFLLPFATHHRFISFVLYVIGEFFQPFREEDDDMINCFTHPFSCGITHI